MFTIKKQATGCTWHLLSKMERQTLLVKRREQERKRKQQERQNQLMIGYINVKYPLIFKEAQEYFNKLRSIYPNKHNLTKTPRFKELKPGTIRDNMALQIPLIEANKPEQPTIPITELPPDLQDINPNSLIDEIPQDQMEAIINELRADSDLRRIMDECEELMAEIPCEELMAEIPCEELTAEIPDLLENEPMFQ